MSSRGRAARRRGAHVPVAVAAPQITEGSNDTASSISTATLPPTEAEIERKPSSGCFAAPLPSCETESVDIPVPNTAPPQPEAAQSCVSLVHSRDDMQHCMQPYEPEKSGATGHLTSNAPAAAAALSVDASVPPMSAAVAETLTSPNAPMAGTSRATARRTSADAASVRSALETKCIETPYSKPRNLGRRSSVVNDQPSGITASNAVDSSSLDISTSAASRVNATLGAAKAYRPSALNATALSDATRGMRHTGSATGSSMDDRSHAGSPPANVHMDVLLLSLFMQQEEFPEKLHSMMKEALECAIAPIRAKMEQVEATIHHLSATA
ncbi:MAG: hypothetical protein EOO65_06110, partial [Methanosarcinales archaeon]